MSSREEDMYEEPEYIDTDIDTICNLCQAEFLDPDDLKLHMCQVHGTNASFVKKCDFCTVIYTDLMDYAEHIRDFHVKTMQCCCYCWRLFDDPYAHNEHKRKHFVSKSASLYGCSQCPMRYGDVDLLKSHEIEHGNNADGVMINSLLPFLSAALKSRAVPFIDALGTDTVYVCGGCDFTTVDLNTFLRHARSKKCNVFVCMKCGFVFNRKSRLARHLERLTECSMFGTKEKKSKLCKDCNIYVNDFASHKSVCRPIRCYSCDVSFKCMNDWSEHQLQVHQGTSIAVETCRFCWKRCVGSIAMHKHIEKVHKPEFHLYKYRCVDCDSVFKHPQKLFGHFFTKHRDIMPYTCKICDIKFRMRKKFTIHIKLEHKSIGSIEFDDKYHVFFAEKKSENPFIPKSIFPESRPKFMKKVSEQEDVEIVEKKSEKKAQKDNQAKTKKSIEKDSESENTENTQDEVQTIENTDCETQKNYLQMSDFRTETEGNQTEVEIIEKPKLRRKRTVKSRKEDQDMVVLESSDDDEPLNLLRKRVCRQQRAKLNKMKRPGQIKSLICKICNKNCYTWQNYHHHKTLHSAKEVKKCIKCSKVFYSTNDLNEHITTAHSSSKLTETLKSLLEKRKTGGSITDDLPTAVKFRRTIKKVKTEVCATSAKITPVDQKLSVQKFFENFIPEESKSEMPVTTTATMKLVTGHCREPAIKLTKFKDTPMKTTGKLAMPTKFTECYPEKASISIKLVETPLEQLDRHDYYSDHYEDSGMDRNESIPEVAEEIMLEGTEETPKLARNEIGHKLVLPNLPTGLTDIRIAHLLPQAPFYKIVKVKDVLTQQSPDEEQNNDALWLPDGTKLVTTNPLAHLLGKEPDKVLDSVKNKYYKPKHKNLQGLLAKALTALEKPLPRKKKQRTSDKSGKK
ncbi:uncharacterized protein LOC142985654 [Anticarsia gemmatalis]|uniref:uncharacterized protein LOC142985654 n=1 Tax=Anticarsia gemmatalis TaxID=129554 RepID=UPI003F7779A9